MIQWNPLSLSMLLTAMMFLTSCTPETSHGTCTGTGYAPIGRTNREEADLAIGNTAILDYPLITFLEFNTIVPTFCRSKEATLDAKIAIHDSGCKITGIRYRIRSIPDCTICAQGSIAPANDFQCETRNLEQRELNNPPPDNIETVTLPLDTSAVAPTGMNGSSYILELWVNDSSNNPSDLVERDIRVDDCAAKP